MDDSTEPAPSGNAIAQTINAPIDTFDPIDTNFENPS
jgi:hypothetical protein